MNKILNILLSVAIGLSSVRLSDCRFKNSYTCVDWVGVQTLIPEVVVPKAGHKDRSKDKTNKTYEFREENPEVTSGEEETLIEDE